MAESARSLSTQLVFVATQLTVEAERWSGGTRRRLLMASDQLLATMRKGYDTPTQRAAAAAFLDSGISYLVGHAMNRATRTLDHTKGVG